jgi:hypothetical protein
MRREAPVHFWILATANFLGKQAVMGNARFSVEFKHDTVHQIA